MAGDWIKVEHVTPDKPEVHRLAEILGLDPDTVMGKLLRLWIWADQQTISGNAFVTPLALLNRIAGHNGFAEAMANDTVKWLEIAPDGSISFPRFDRHNGACAKMRATTLKRVKRFRNVTSVTKALPEKRREEIENINTAPLSPPVNKSDPAIAYLHNHPQVPKNIDTANFREAWERWQADLGERGIKATSGQLSGQLSDLEAMGPVRAIEAIDNAIKNRLRSPALPFEKKSPSSKLQPGQVHHEKTPCPISGEFKL